MVSGISSNDVCLLGIVAANVCVFRPGLHEASPGGNGKVTFLLGFGTQRRVTWRLAGATLVTWHALPSVKKSALELKKVLEA